jgi:hypothetical protein
MDFFSHNLANLGHFFHEKSIGHVEIIFFRLKFGKLLPEKKHCFRAKDNQHPSAWIEQLPAHQLAVLSTGWGQFFGQSELTATNGRSVHWMGCVFSFGAGWGS